MTSLTNHLRRVLLFACAVVLAVTMPAQGAIGEWKSTIYVGDNEAWANLKIFKDEKGVLTGVMSSEQGDANISNIELEKGVLTFSMAVNFGGTDITIGFEGEIEGDELSGWLFTDDFEMELAGKREATKPKAAAKPAAAKAPKSPLAGIWNVTSSSQLGELERKLVIKTDHSGTYESEAAKWPIRNLRLDSDKVVFSVTVSVQGQDLPLYFEGKLDGTKLAGKYSNAELGDVADVTATKASSSVRVVFETSLGEFELEVDAAAAPMTAANFLKYVDEGFYDGGQFHRSVRLDNQTRDDVLIEVVQASVKRGREGFAPIALERTDATGLEHSDGTVSMARGGPDTATSSFFICIGDQPSLDFGGERNADGQGFAAFGRVIRGMDVIKQIHESPTERENLTPPIEITTAKRAGR